MKLFALLRVFIACGLDCDGSRSTVFGWSNIEMFRQLRTQGIAIAGRSNTLLFVLFLGCLGLRSRGCPCPLAFFPQSDRCGFPLKNFRHQALAHYTLGPSYHRSCIAATAPRCLCIRFRQHLTHTSFLDAVVPLCAAQPHVTLEPWCTTTIILNHIGLTRRTGS
jgi:hypothetical protein